jgi:hypothetical protein
MQQATLKNLYQQGLFDSVSVLRKNESGYPFVTLLKNGDKTKSTNLYFGRKSGTTILDNFEVGDAVAKALSNASVILTENAQGEKRFKISLTEGSSEYESGASLEDVFGIREKNVDFDFNLFKAEFKVREPIQVPADKVAA